jgi:hypothetical protein
MSDERGASARSPGAVNGVTPSDPVADRERVLLLECRLEQMRSALDEARDEADRARTRLAEASAREAEHGRRYGLVHEELAEARAEIAALHRHLARSESLREELAGHLFEGGAREDAYELVRLRQKVLAEDERALVADRTVARLRARVEELVSSREMLLTRIAEWQQLIRKGEPEAADLSEFLAELRREILDLEHRSVTSDAREAVLRERLARAGIDPDQKPAEPAQALEEPAVASLADAVIGADEPEVAEEVESAVESAVEEAVVPPEAEPAASVEAADGPRTSVLRPAVPDRGSAARGPTDALVAELGNAGTPTLQSDLLLKLGRSGDAAAAEAIDPWTGSSEPSVRAAAYEALGRLLERSPDALAPHLERGLADPDPRVRRRVVLAAATARGLAAPTLLDPLREDPDAQVRRVVRHVLRQAVEPDPRGPRPSRPLATRPPRTRP